MTDEHEGQRPDGWLKITWNILVQVAVWVCAFIASMLLPPVSGVVESEQDPTARLSKYTIFIIAVVIGLSFVLAKKLNRKKHVGLWVFMTLVFLGSSVYLVNRNYQLNNTLTCSCNGKSVIKGTQYKDPQVVAVFFPRGVDCPILCKNFANPDGKVVPEKVWTEDSINESRRTLFISYVICFPAVALTIISVVQAIYCSTRRM